MPIDFDFVGTIASSTTEYFGTFSPLFEMIGGLVLAFVVMAFIVSLFARRGGMSMDDALPDLDTND